MVYKLCRAHPASSCHVLFSACAEMHCLPADKFTEAVHSAVLVHALVSCLSTALHASLAWAPTAASAN